mmetsp:Transcript_25354/g.31241  ORF Transcript_25354/g.31241 Transcript_25354/m.31241 type:complete len:119 (-) Transcript_25354:277-633(-)
MADRITRTLTFMRSVQSAHRVGYLKTMKSIFFSPTHFPKILGCIFISSTVAGYCIMDDVQTKRIQRQEDMYRSAWEANSLRRLQYEETSNLSFTPAVRRLSRKMTNQIRASVGSASSY